MAQERSMSAAPLYPEEASPWGRQAMARAIRDVFSLPEIRSAVPWEEMIPSFQQRYLDRADQLAAAYQRHRKGAI